MSEIRQCTKNLIEKVAGPIQIKKKIKRCKDPLAPKMPRSAFIIYFQVMKEKFMKQYPSMNL